jgi:hypothetical protein
MASSASLAGGQAPPAGPAERWSECSWQSYPQYFFLKTEIDPPPYSADRGPATLGFVSCHRVVHTQRRFVFVRLRCGHRQNLVYRPQASLAGTAFWTWGRCAEEL